MKCNSRTVAPGMSDYQIMSQIGSLRARIQQDAEQGLAPDKRRAAALAKYEAEQARRAEAAGAPSYSHTRPIDEPAPGPAAVQPAAAIATGSRIHTEPDDYLRSALADLLQEYSLGTILECTWETDRKLFEAAHVRNGAAA